jgi:UDP-N-acetylglucosamine--N-acetylmuramyl-(pentapeptide) pyrophosphoryl-undecaprenol N-acetylglucosamine transferase
MKPEVRLDRVLFAGGGTGGHVYMAIAVAQQLAHRHPGIEIVFGGTPQGLESRIVPRFGYRLETIQIGGLKNVGLRRIAQTMWELPISTLASLRIVRRLRPQAVAGVGGYSSGPLVLASSLLRIPSLVIEPNVHPGLANRLVKTFIRKAAVAYAETAHWFGAKAVVTGVPIREEFFAQRDHDFRREPLTVLIFGGSRGSRPLNGLVLDGLKALNTPSIRLIHQTGPEHFEAVLEGYRRHRIDQEVVPYIENMPEYFGRADLIVSRAGASTIAEITAAGRPALLVPFPHAADDHQTKNARALEARGAALTLEEKNVSGDSLAEAIRGLESNRNRLEEMAQASRATSRPGAARAVAELMEEIAA